MVFGVTYVVLLIADISGYTRFMLSHQKALAHSHMVIQSHAHQAVA